MTDPTSGLSPVERRVEFAELDAGIWGGEAPLDFHLLGVAILFPGAHLATHRRDVSEAAIQTLATERREFDLGHVQPRSMLGV